MLIDIDGDPYSYHVEFLGKTHSHSWIAAKFIEVYGHKAQSGLDDSLSQTDVQTRKVNKLFLSFTYIVIVIIKGKIC